MKWTRRLKRSLQTTLGVSAIAQKLDETKILTAQTLIQQIRARGVLPNLQEAEFKVFSQFGDDGIIQYLIHQVEILRPLFVEFGVENYTEANTRFLLIHNNWQGLVIDADPDHVDWIQQDPIYWQFNLQAVCARIDKTNLNDILRQHQLTGEIGLLSIDIDGNDYWVWANLEVVNPVIVVAEYNSVFGCSHALTVPYDPQFDRTKAHYSHLFWGCSLKALVLLAEQRGYGFVGCNRHGNNAYFVRRDRLGAVPTVSLEAGYVRSQFRDSRDPAGQLSFLSGDDRLRAIADMVVYDIEKDALIRLGDLGE